MSRLIDGDALLESIRQSLAFRAGMPGAKRIFEIVEKSKPMDAEPVRHGRWEKRKEDALIHWGCSVCGIGFLDDKGLEKLHYCPHCGAKMDLPQQSNADRCVLCGEIVPEGRQVCKKCEWEVMGE